MLTKYNTELQNAINSRKELTNVKKIEFFHRSFNTNAQPCEGGIIVAMQGFNRLEDFYLCIPEKGLFTRAANIARYGNYKKELFIDGAFIGAVNISRLSRTQKLYNAGYPDQAADYALGYMLFSETTLGGGKINKHKEAARISHFICDDRGREGHEIRQQIRRYIKANIINI